MPSAQARVGQVLRDKWRLDRLIGLGGMAAVYAATHRNRMRGAVKMLHVELSVSADARKRFLREGYVANNVEHPGVVRVLDDDVTEDGSVFLVMELLEGQTVDALVETRPGKRLEVGEVLAIADDVLDVLAAAHERGIVHRDLKPENLFLTRDGQLKVLDFGIARLRDMGTASNATSTGIAMGTPAFMPPEQALGNWAEVDARTDLWAVGATMYSLLTGRFVHETDTIQKLMLAAMTKPAPRLALAARDAPPQVCAIVDCALSFEQDGRWPSARAMQRAVREARAGAPHRFGPRPAPAPATMVSCAASTDATVAALDLGPTPAPVAAGARAIAPAIVSAPGGPGAVDSPAVGRMTTGPVTSSFFADASSPTVQRRSRSSIVTVAVVAALVMGGGLFFAIQASRAPVTAAPDSVDPARAAGTVNVPPSGEPAGTTDAPAPADAAPTAAASVEPAASATAAAEPRRVPGAPTATGAPPATAKPAAPSPPRPKPPSKAMDRW